MISNIAFQLEALIEKASELEDDLDNTVTMVLDAYVTRLLRLLKMEQAEWDLDGKYDEGFDDGKQKGYEEGFQEGQNEV